MVLSAVVCPKLARRPILHVRTSRVRRPRYARPPRPWWLAILLWVLTPQASLAGPPTVGVLLGDTYLIYLAKKLMDS